MASEIVLLPPQHPLVKMHDGLPSDEQDPIHLSDAPHRIAFLSAAVLEVRASLPPSFSLFLRVGQGAYFHKRGR